MAEGVRVSLMLDLGDLFTKALAQKGASQQSFRFPSAIAGQLVDADQPPTGLLLDEGTSPMQRSVDFDANRYPRWRSYPGAKSFAESAWKVHGEPVRGARFSGWLAAVHGADRELLGHHPTEKNVGALLHRALIEAASGASRADVTFVLDAGPKAEALARYARGGPRSVHFLGWTFQERAPRRFDIELSMRVVDAAVCAVGRLPPELRLAQVGRALFLDVGYFRTKLYIVSSEGCEHQELLDLGVSDCVRRILRDGQEQDLVEDEFAIVRAVEASQDVIEVAGRRYSIGSILRSAATNLEQELANAARRALVAHYERGGKTCSTAALIGGGAALVGEGLAARLRALELGIDRIRVDASPELLVQGATGLRRASADGSRRASA